MSSSARGAALSEAAAVVAFSEEDIESDWLCQALPINHITNNNKGRQNLKISI
jgi:hypothetical protein